MNEDSWLVRKSTHYTFHFQEKSPSERNINEIISIQEGGHQLIEKTLKYKSLLMINYYFYNDPLACGNKYYKLRDESKSENRIKPINAFAWYPVSVHATYNYEIKAIGTHEDIHLIMYELTGQIGSRFLCEGISVGIENVWLMYETHQWVKYLLDNKYLLNIEDLINDLFFDSMNTIITYPLAGSFCSWFITKYGFDIFLTEYKKSSSEEDCIKPYMVHYKDYINNLSVDNFAYRGIENIVKKNQLTTAST
jgi:hypothetical protein